MMTRIEIAIRYSSETPYGASAGRTSPDEDNLRGGDIDEKLAEDSGKEEDDQRGAMRGGKGEILDAQVV